MDYKSYEWRIALSLVMLLILIQVAGFIAVQRSNRAIAMSVVENELRTASLVCYALSICAISNWCNPHRC